jgi:hypothetical protein
MTKYGKFINRENVYKLQLNTSKTAHSLVASLVSPNILSFDHIIYTGCFKKSFTNLKAYRNLYRGHTECFELSKCSKTHQVLPPIVIRNCFDLFFRLLLHGKKEVEMELDRAVI